MSDAGKAADAFLGVRGLNKRKGVRRSRNALLDHLADIIITAAAAMNGVTSDVDEARIPGTTPGLGDRRRLACEQRPAARATCQLRQDARNSR
jgi:hypothetical protein